MSDYAPVTVDEENNRMTLVLGQEPSYVAIAELIDVGEGYGGFAIALMPDASAHGSNLPNLKDAQYIWQFLFKGDKGLGTLRRLYSFASRALLQGRDLETAPGRSMSLLLEQKGALEQRLEEAEAQIAELTKKVQKYEQQDDNSPSQEDSENNASKPADSLMG